MSSTNNSSLFAGLPELPLIPETEPARICLDAFRTAIAVQVSKSIGVDREKVYEAIQTGTKGCDCNLAIPRFKLKEDAKTVAKRVAEEVSGVVHSFQAKQKTFVDTTNLYRKFVVNDFIAKAESAGTPFVNFHFHTPTLARLVMHQINGLNYIDENAPSSSTSAHTNGTSTSASHSIPSASIAYGYGTNRSAAGKNVVIDFSSPNIAKPFHAGHLRSTIIGMFIANVYTANGWSVTKLNYLGDWGKQYGILAVGFDKYGNEEKLLADPIKHLYDVYVAINVDAKKEVEEAIRLERTRLLSAAAEKGETAMLVNDKKETVELKEELPFTRAEEDFGDRHSTIHSEARAIFKRMEDGEKSALAIWARFRDLSIKKYEEIYARLNIEFDVYSGESQISLESQSKAIDILLQKKVVKEDQGALLVDLQQYKLGKTPVRKRDGTNLYITRDIGGAIEKYDKYKFDKVSSPV